MVAVKDRRRSQPASVPEQPEELKGRKKSSLKKFTIDDDKPIHKQISVHIDETAIDTYNYVVPEGEEEDIFQDLNAEPKSLSRTSLLLLDYRQFKAARTIQRAWRGFFVRLTMERRSRAASIIQRFWRFFYAHRRYYEVLESTLQKRIEAHYNRQAIIIQSLWRGYWVRQNVHDQYRLKRKQVTAAKDLMYCVAFKLHHLLRTYQIPGIYSLRNSHCLSKVEQLLAAISFKEHNAHVRIARARREAMIHEAKKAHKASAYATNIPYCGPNYRGYCEPECCGLYNERDADKRMLKILSLYERAAGVDPRVQRLMEEKKLKYSGKVKPKPPDFCSDVVDSMKRWQILTKNNLTVDPNVFRNPENVEKFLTEIQSLYEAMQARCHCRLSVVKPVKECA